MLVLSNAQRRDIRFPQPRNHHGLRPLYTAFGLRVRLQRAFFVNTQRGQGRYYVAGADYPGACLDVQTTWQGTRFPKNTAKFLYEPRKAGPKRKILV